MKFKKGDKIKVKNGGIVSMGFQEGIQRYKRGSFSHYSKTGKFGYFINTSTGKLLKRRADEFLSA
jgi:hypothetical protein